MEPLRKACVRTLLWILHELSPNTAAHVYPFHAVKPGAPERVASQALNYARGAVFCTRLLAEAFSVRFVRRAP